MLEKDVFEAFASKWIASSQSVEEADVTQAETQLAVALPSSYRRFVLKHGLPFCPALLGAIVDGEHEVHDLQEFIAIGELLEATAGYESAGMELGFVGFATDCMGNMFMFRKTECVPGAADAPVWFFDHDFVTSYLRGLFVDFDSEGRVEFIELANRPLFSARFEGLCLHGLHAEEAVAHVARFAGLELNGSEPGYSYVFPELDLSLWRGTKPQANQDANDLDGRHFEAVGIGARGYFHSRA